MAGRVSKNDAVALIEEALRDAEEAIGNHSSEAADLYARRGESFLARNEGQYAAKWSQKYRLGTHEVRTIQQYLCASALMSGWIACKADSEEARRTWGPACELVSTTGIPYDEAVDQLTLFEAAWRGAIRGREATAAAPGCIVLLLIITVAAIALWLIFFR